MPNTAARRRTIRRIIANQEVGSQSNLVDQLSDGGFEVTQATISRDLKELGAVKVRGANGKSLYALAVPGTEGDAGEQTIRRHLVEFAETIVPTANLVVIQTPPGAAQVVAGAIDRGGLEGVLGTVAGDDTLLVVVAEAVGGARVAQHLEKLGAGP